VCFVWFSEETVNFALYVINRLVFITEVESVYSAVRTESLYNRDTSRPLRVKFGSAFHPTHFKFELRTTVYLAVFYVVLRKPMLFDSRF